MDKNMYFVEEVDKADNGSKQDSNGELFVNRVSRNGVVLKFKVGKYGKHTSSHELTFSEKKNTSGELENFESNTHICSEQSEIRNAELRNNKRPFLDSTMGTDPDEEVSRAEMVNNSCKKDGEMMSAKSVAMDTCMAGTYETNSSPNAKIFSKENVINGTCFTENREASASEKNCSSPSEEHICHQCWKQFQSIDSLHGHKGSHRRDDYKLIRTILEQPTCKVIEKQELKSIWKALQALLKMSTVSGWNPVHNIKAADVTCSSKDINGVKTQMMEVADVLIKLSQTVSEDVVKAQSPTERIFMCTACNKIFDSYQALGGHISSHNKQPKIRQYLATAGNSGGSGEWLSLKYYCNKCNESFPNGQSLGGHKRKHFFEEQHRRRLVTDGNMKASVSLPRFTMHGSGAVFSANDNLGVDDDTVNLRVQTPYDAVQPLQANKLINETEAKLSPFVRIGTVERCVLGLKKLSLEDNNGEP